MSSYASDLNPEWVFVGTQLPDGRVQVLAAGELVSGGLLTHYPEPDPLVEQEVDLGLGLSPTLIGFHPPVPSPIFTTSICHRRYVLAVGATYSEALEKIALVDPTMTAMLRVDTED